MKIAEGISNEARQRHLLPIDGFDDCEIILEWRDTQYSWFCSLSWAGWNVKNLRVSMLPNMLGKWANILPFGLSVVSKNGQDPLSIDAFSSGESSLYILTAEEVLDLRELYG